MSDRELLLRFALTDSDISSPSDFVDLFAFSADVVSELIETEAVEALRSSEVESRDLLDCMAQLQRQLRAGPVPATVEEVAHGSPWHLLLNIPAVVAGAFVAKCLLPDVKRAWKGSAAQDTFYSFFRHSVFGGAKRKVQDAVMKRPGRKRIKATEVRELPDSTERSQRLEVRVAVSQPLAAEITNRELIDAFRRRMDAGA